MTERERVRALEAVTRYRDCMFPTGEDRAALCHAAVVLADEYRVLEEKYAAQSMKLTDAQEEVSRLFGQVVELGGNPFKITGEDIKTLRTVKTVE